MGKISINNLLKNTIKKLDTKIVMPTGIRLFDDEIGGFEPGDFVFLGSWTPSWSYKFLIQLSLEMAKEQKVCFRSFSDNEKSLAKKMTRVILKASFSDKEIHFDDSQRSFLSHYTKNLNLLVNCNNLSSFSDLKLEIWRLKHSENVEVIFLDGAELLLKETQWKKLAKLAKRLSMCIVCSYPLPIKEFINTKKDCTPDLGIFDHFNIKSVIFDKIFFLHNDEFLGIVGKRGPRSPQLLDFIVAKDRNGDFYSNSRLKLDIYGHIVE